MHVQNRATGLICKLGATVSVLLVVLLGAERLAFAQTASPAATPGSVVCDVEPRTDEEIEQLAALAATPMAATPEPVDGSIWIEGTPVDAATLSDIERTLSLV